jgi:hypothetical protein
MDRTLFKLWLEYSSSGGYALKAIMPDVTFPSFSYNEGFLGWLKGASCYSEKKQNKTKNKKTF